METLFSIFRVNHWGEFWWIMVGFVGQAMGLLVYARNLWLIHGAKRPS